MNKFDKIEDVLSCDIEEFFSENVVNKSRKYLLGQRITDYQYNGGKIIQAFVKGSYKYFVTLSVFDNKFSSTCTCSSTGKCKHMAALFQYAKDKLIQSNDIKVKTFDSECNDFFNKLKLEMHNRNMISKENFPYFCENIEKKITQLKQLDGEEFVDYYIKLMNAIEKYNFNSYLNNDFYKLELKVSSINPNLVIENLNRLLLNVKDLNNVVGNAILSVLLNCYIEYIIRNKEINLQNNRNAITIINFLDVRISSKNEKKDFCKYINVINFYSGVDNAVKEIENNLDDKLYLQAYINLLIMDKEHQKALDIFEKYFNNKFDSFWCLLNIIEVNYNLYGKEAAKSFILKYLPKNLEEKENLYILKEKYNDLFDDIFENEFLLSLKKNYQEDILRKLSNDDIKYSLFMMSFDELDEKFDSYHEKYANSFLMCYFYHLELKIHTIGFYDYNGYKKLLSYLNKLEKLPLGKYYIYELYMLCVKLSKDKLATEMKKFIRFIEY